MIYTSYIWDLVFYVTTLFHNKITIVIHSIGLNSLLFTLHIFSIFSITILEENSIITVSNDNNVCDIFTVHGNWMELQSRAVSFLQLSSTLVVKLC